MVSRLAEAFAARRIESAIAISDWSAGTLRTGQDGHHRFRFAVVGAPRLTVMGRAVIALPLRLMRLWRILRRGRVEAINFHYVSLDALGVALLKRLGCYRGTLTLSFHGTDVRKPGSAIERGLWQFMLASSDTLTACSSSLAATLVATHGEVCRGTRVIHNGVDAALFRPAEKSAPKVTRYFVSVGSYIPRKGHLTLLKAFARLAAAYPDVGLLFVGQEGSERQPLLQVASSNGLESRVDCRVDLRPDEVAAAVAGAVASVQPSVAEPFGIAVIEAGACGVPVIASAVGGHLEVLAPSPEGALGFLFDAGDVEQCEAQMRRVLDKPAEAASMADRFRRIVVSRYTWDACATRYAAAAGRTDGEPGTARAPA